MDPYSIIKFAQNAINIALFFEKLAHCMSEEGRKVQGLTRKLKVITTIGQEPWGILVEQFVMTLIGLWDTKAINFSKVVVLYLYDIYVQKTMKTKELIKYFYGFLNLGSSFQILSVNFAVQVMKTYYVCILVYID